MRYVYNTIAVLFFVVLLGTFVYPDFFEMLWLWVSGGIFLLLVVFHFFSHKLNKPYKKQNM